MNGPIRLKLNLNAIAGSQTGLNRIQNRIDTVLEGRMDFLVWKTKKVPNDNWLKVHWTLLTIFSVICGTLPIDYLKPHLDSVDQGLTLSDGTYGTKTVLTSWTSLDSMDQSRLRGPSLKPSRLHGLGKSVETWFGWKFW